MCSSDLDQRTSRQAQSVAGPAFPGLLEGLKKSRGCLGIETALTSSGKNVVFAWFEDKDAVLEWYYSDVHQELMDKFFPDRENREPLDDVPDGAGPIMAIASISMTKQPQVEGTSLPISQIAIELYAPVTGGLALGGRFAPNSVKVKNLRSYDK